MSLSKLQKRKVKAQHRREDNLALKVEKAQKHHEKGRDHEDSDKERSLIIKEAEKGLYVDKCKCKGPDVPMKKEGAKKGGRGEMDSDKDHQEEGNHCFVADKKVSSLESYYKHDLVIILNKLGEYVESLGEELKEKDNLIIN